MLKITRVVAALLILAFPHQARARQSRPSLRARLEPFIVDVMKEHGIPGLAVGVVSRGRVIYAGGFGVMKLGGRERVDARTMFHMASVTKLFTATAVVQLAERGKINLDAGVTEYLPYFRMKDARYAGVTVRQMLNHTSGMPDVEDYGWDKPQYDAGALERYVRSLNLLSLDHAPGERFAYSNIAYDVLGDVVAKASGMSFENYVGRNILAPLGMKHSTLLVREVSPASLASPHVSDPSGKVTISDVFPYNRPHAPSSTLYSNVEDMSRWALANLRRGELGGRRILRASSYEMLWGPRARVEGGAKFPTEGKIGLGWFAWNYGGQRLVGHAGADVGFNSFLLLAPESSDAVIVVGNLYPTPENYLPTGSYYVAHVAEAAMRLLLPRARAAKPQGKRRKHTTPNRDAEAGAAGARARVYAASA